MRHVALGFVVTLFLLPGLAAQTFTTSPCKDSDSSHSDGGSWLFGHNENACELRHEILPLEGNQVGVSDENGSIEVVGDDRHDVELEARVVAQGSDHNEASALLHRIEINTHGTIHATGPQSSGWGHHGWSVSYRLRVPRQVAARLHTSNGSISLTDVSGGSNIETVNGGLTLRNLSGDVHASTVNGSMHIALDGTKWNGAGLTAKTVNGAIAVQAPEGYSAHLNAETTNGAIAVAFPTSSGGSERHHIDTDIGNGGAPLHFETVNGAVSIGRQ